MQPSTLCVCVCACGLLCCSLLTMALWVTCSRSCQSWRQPYGKSRQHQQHETACAWARQAGGAAGSALAHSSFAAASVCAAAVEELGMCWACRKEACVAACIASQGSGMHCRPACQHAAACVYYVYYMLLGRALCSRSSQLSLESKIGQSKVLKFCHRLRQEEHCIWTGSKVWLSLHSLSACFLFSIFIWVLSQCTRSKQDPGLVKAAHV